MPTTAATMMRAGSMPAQRGVPVAAFVRSPAAAGSVALALVLSGPTAPSAAQWDALAPTACTVEPLTAEEIAALVAAATPAADPASRVVPGGGPACPPALPQGEPADPKTVAGVTAAALEFAGCRNADDLPRRLALMTDRLAAEVAGSEDGDGQGGAATPVVEEVPAPTITAVRVRDVGVLPDGRVGAVVTWRAEGADDGRPDRETNFHVFARIGDRWLLDEDLPLSVTQQRGAVYSEGGRPAPASLRRRDPRPRPPRLRRGRQRRVRRADGDGGRAPRRGPPDGRL
jgi:hypothetical protein